MGNCNSGWKNMAYISHQQLPEISFSNVSVRPKTGGWKMLADVEGNLTITLGKNIFFNKEYILLLELAVALIRWVNKIKSGEIANFHYESMDYEDEPILAFIINDDQTWRLYSVWETFTNSSHISSEELLQATKKFIAELIIYLKTNFGLDMSNLHCDRL